MSLSPGLSLVTGATGFVGSAVARALVGTGHEIRVLARPNGDRRNLVDLSVEVAEGSLEDAASLSRAVAGCRYLFHVAADYRLWVTDPAPMFRANVVGTRVLMRAALDAGVERVVYTSSVATLGLVPQGSADEETPSNVEDMIGPYKRSKFQAEEVVRGLIARRALPAVIVNPSAPVGPRDCKPTPTGRIVLEAARARMPGSVETGLNIGHVDDVAAENLSLARILSEGAQAAGTRAPRIRIPYTVAYPVAIGAELMARLSGKEPFITLDGVRMAQKKMYFTSEKASRELGYTPRPARHAIVDAIGWFKANGYLR